MGKLEAYSAFGDFVIRAGARAVASAWPGWPRCPTRKVFLGSGGGDGVDTAAKLARRYWLETGQAERQHIVVRSNGYHGTHGFGTSLAGIEANRSSWGPLIPDIAVVDHDSSTRCASTSTRSGADRVAAVFVEPVIGAGGVRPPAARLHRGRRRAVRRARHPVRLRLGDLRLRPARHLVRHRALGRQSRT